MSNMQAIAQLATRMNVDDRLASQWLHAVLEVLAGSFDEQTGQDMHNENASALPDVGVVPVIRPVTSESWEAIRCQELEIRHFPFRFGREGRMGCMRPGMARKGDRRAVTAKPNNDHYLLDRGTPLNISREHFQIERARDGSFELVDRGSACGTIVSGNTVGGEYTGGRIPLHDGDTIVVGTPSSPYVFTLHLEPQD